MLHISCPYFNHLEQWQSDSTDQLRQGLNKSLIKLSGRQVCHRSDMWREIWCIGWPIWKLDLKKANKCEILDLQLENTGSAFRWLFCYLRCILKLISYEILLFLNHVSSIMFHLEKNIIFFKHNHAVNVYSNCSFEVCQHFPKNFTFLISSGTSTRY